MNKTAKIINKAMALYGGLALFSIAWTSPQAVGITHPVMQEIVTEGNPQPSGGSYADSAASSQGALLGPITETLRISLQTKSLTSSWKSIRRIWIRR